MRRSKICRLLGNLVTHFSVTLRGVSRALTWSVVSILLQRCERFVVVGFIVVTYLNLMHVWCSLFRDPVLSGITLWNLVWLVLPLSSFKLVALFKAHLEIVFSLGSFVLFDTDFVNCWGSRLGQASLVFAHVVHLMAAEWKVGFVWADTGKNHISFLFALLYRIRLFLFRLSLNKAILRSTLWEIIVLWRQVRPSKLLDEFLALGLGTGVIISSMV